MSDKRKPSVRADIVTRRTYNRPLNEAGTLFETWAQTVERVINHQEWLWTRALGRGLSSEQHAELSELKQLMLDRKVSPSGRSLWLGGTPTGQTKESSMFNCAFLRIQTVYDCVDAMWLLLNGCGVGFMPQVGTLNGFLSPIKNVEFKRSYNSPSFRGNPNSVETVENGVWTIKVGDSAEAWAKTFGKILARKVQVDTLVIDTSEIRGPGERLKGYGWICTGDEPLIKALDGVVALMNRKAGALLSRIDMLDLINWMGTTLSTRRSAEICLFNIEEPEWQEFATAKREYWVNNIQREQSNNSLVFNHKPTREALEHVFRLMETAGGSEPGFINGMTARRRAPWFYGVNPCAEILLGDKSFCNLTEIDLAKFRGDVAGLIRAVWLTARANYRQTCVNLKDGILQEAWHLNNDFLRLCGVGLTGIAMRPDMVDYDFQVIQRMAIAGAYSMATELKLPLPKNITTVKPSGTLSKIMDTTEGVHKPLGKYIFNNINFSKHDPLVNALREAGYKVQAHPTKSDTVLVTIPVKFEGVEFDVVDGKEVNKESAVSQLERYKMLQRHWTQQNTSVTISYDLEEVPSIITWLLENWDDYVGVSFIYRTDPSKTAADLGYQYLPQEVVTEEVWNAYNDSLLPVDIDKYNSLEEIKDQECAGGVCPIK
jgi:adenosylcobalamin-dependent ribonucleoside-triphosphate reductase